MVVQDRGSHGWQMAARVEVSFLVLTPWLGVRWNLDRVSFHILLHQRRFHSQLPSHSLPPASACWDCSAGAGNGALHHYHQDIHDTFRMASRLLELL